MQGSNDFFEAQIAIDHRRRMRTCFRELKEKVKEMKNDFTIDELKFRLECLIGHLCIFQLNFQDFEQKYNELKLKIEKLQNKT
jgi:hypothetical protein